MAPWTPLATRMLSIHKCCNNAKVGREGSGFLRVLA